MDGKVGWLGAVALTVVVAGGCTPPAKRPRVGATPASGTPPHATQVAQGLWSCEHGYLMRDNQCVPEDVATAEPRMQIYTGEDLEAPPPEPVKQDRRLTSMPGFAWNEADYPPRAVPTYAFSLTPDGFSTVIGEPTSYTLPEGKTVYEAARHLGLGMNQVGAAFPDLDFVNPPFGDALDFPTWWVLPESDYRGIVINVPEMRIYYFPDEQPGAVITYPVGLGDDKWQTPIARFRVIGKEIDPPWFIPETIRAEHIRERNDPRTSIPGGATDNPLGHYRLKLSLPLYGIHGTNVPWGIGMEVTHGCIRLYPEDIERFFPMVPVGTPGQFLYQPVKVGARGGEIFIEVHPDIYETKLNYLAEALRSLEARGWKDRIDWRLLTEAVEAKRGTPTRISS